jgi:hypothetical protein
MHPSFSGLFVTCAYFPATAQRSNARPPHVRITHGVVGNLAITSHHITSVLTGSVRRTPDHLARIGHKAKLAHVDLNHSAFCDHAKRCVNSRLWVLFHAQYLELKSRLRKTLSIVKRRHPVRSGVRSVR